MVKPAMMEAIAEASDAELVSQYALVRDAEAFAELVRRHAGLVFAAARRVTGNAHDAEDVAQACFLELAQKAGTVRDSVAGWLHTAATRRATDLVRSDSARRRNERERADDVLVGTGAEWDDIEARLDEVIARLPEELREPVVQHFLEGQTQAAVAAKLGVNQATVSRRLGAAVERLRENLGVKAPAGVLVGLIVAHAVEPCPASVATAATKVGLAGVGGSASVAAPKVAFFAGAVVIASAAGVAALVSSAPPSSPPTAGGTSIVTTATAEGNVMREGDRVWIEGVPRLEWGKSGETTFCGALSAALSAIGPERDYGTLMGETGAVFRVRWYQGPAPRRWSGASAVAEQVEERALISAAIGRPIMVRWAYPGDASRAEVIGEAMASIDAGRPVLVYLSPAFDMGTMYGHGEGGAVALVRDYYDRTETDPARPVEKLGGFFLFLGEAGQPLSQRDAAIAGLRAGVRNWTRTDRPSFDEEGTFAYGQEGYAAWIADLRSAETLDDAERELLFGTSNWTMNCLNDARWAASRYLRKVAPLFEGEVRAGLERAAGTYESIGRETGGPIFGQRAVFLGPWSGKSVADWTPEVREREVMLLERARELDGEAIRAIGEALASLVSAEEVEAFLRDVGRNNMEAVRAKLEARPELVWATTDEGMTGLLSAAGDDRLAVAALLLDRGSDLEAVDAEYGDTPLGWAAFYGQVEAARFFIERGAEVNHTLKDGGTILSLALNGERGQWKQWSKATAEQYRAVAEVLRRHGAVE